MRSYAILVALAAVAAAHSSGEHEHESATVPQLPTPTAGDAAATSIASKINECIAKCDPTDTTCQAKCVAVPAPNEDQVNETIACSAKCDQGDGSAADTEAFAQCLTKCRDEHFFSEGAGTPDPTNGSGSGSGSGSGTETTGTGAAATETGSGSGSSGDSTESGSGSGSSETGSATGSAAQASTTAPGSGAASLHAFASVPLLGLVAAFFL